MRSHRRLRASLYQLGASATNSVQSLHAANWALRMVLSGVQNDLLSQDADLFLRSAGPFLLWSRAGMKRFLECFSGDPERLASLAAMAPADAWRHFAGDPGLDAAGTLASFRVADPARFQRTLQVSLLGLEKSLALAADPLADNIQRLRPLVGLGPTECRILHLATYAAQSPAINGLLCGTRIASFADAVSVIGMLIHEAEGDVARALKASAPLSEFRLVNVDRIAMSIGETVVIEDWFKQYISEPHDSMDEMMRHFITAAGHGALAAEDYPHLADDLEALTRYLRGAREAGMRGVNVLIYGKPGTGKTEFSKLLATQLGAKLYEVASATPDGFPIVRGARVESLKLSQRFLARQEGALILFDEIEDVFPEDGDGEFARDRRRPPQAGKAWMNRMLEGNEVPVIWVSNRIDRMDRAYLRRFSYHLEIRTPPASVRHRIARRYLENTPVSGDFIQQIAGESGLTPALLESTAKVVSLSGALDCESAERLATRVIRQCQAAMGQSASHEIRTIATQYSLDYLNIDSRYSIDQIVSSLARRPSSSLCFYGLPGTGKTALAEHIAVTIGKPLLIKRASDLLSRWLGQSEENIAEMFEEATAQQSVLFLDEADSLLRNREQAQKGWEVSQVNELLQQMERFNGVFICATNLFGQIDAAALRRFAFKIAFKAMRPEQRRRMFIREALGGDEARLCRSLGDRLNALESLVPGDFAVVKRQAALIGIDPDPDQFISELEAECRLKPAGGHRPIGFLA